MRKKPTKLSFSAKVPWDQQTFSEEGSESLPVFFCYLSFRHTGDIGTILELYSQVRKFNHGFENILLIIVYYLLEDFLRN